MKKFILFACAAVMSLSASAQAYKQSVMNDEAKLMAQKAMFTQDLMGEKAQFVSNKSTASKAMRRAEARDGIYGLYISSSTNYKEESDGCDSVYLRRCDKEVEGVKCNVEFYMYQIGSDKNGNPVDRNTVFYGQYDEANKTITCPIQEALNVDPYGSILLFSWTGDLSDLDHVTIDTKNPFTFTVEDDGSVSLNQTGLCFYMYEYEQKNPDADGVIWNNMFNVAYKPANAVMKFQTYNQKKQDFSEPYYCAVSVEDFTYSMNVYGYASYGAMIPGGGGNGFGLSGTVLINVNQDLTVSLPAGQNVWNMRALGITSSGDYDSAFGEWMYTQGSGADGYPDANTPCEGVMGGNTMTFESVAIASNFIDGKGYGMWTYNHEIVLNEGDYAAGIENVNAETRADKIKNNKCYNVFGQQVSDSAKGLIICGGKKYVK